MEGSLNSKQAKCESSGKANWVGRADIPQARKVKLSPTYTSRRDNLSETICLRLVGGKLWATRCVADTFAGRWSYTSRRDSCRRQVDARTPGGSDRNFCHCPAEFSANNNFPRSAIRPKMTKIKVHYTYVTVTRT